MSSLTVASVTFCFSILKILKIKILNFLIIKTKGLKIFKKIVKINYKDNAYLSDFIRAIFLGRISANITINTDITIVE